MKNINKEVGKKSAALRALDFIEQDMVLGVGSGSTVDYFIAALALVKQKIEGTVASSVATANKLKALSIPVLDLNSISELPLYVDGADEINAAKQMIKGGGAALTREKIIATVAKKFICIADESKQVDLLGDFPVAVEVIPMARGLVARALLKLGGMPEYREGFVTDNRNIILDVFNLNLSDPVKTEEVINNITGVVCNGIFAKRHADKIIIGTSNGVRII